VGRRTLDSVFYRHDTRRLRDNLRRLARLAGEEREALDENLALALDSMCTSVPATFGLIIVFKDDGLWLAAGYRWQPTDLSLSAADLAADDVLLLDPGHFSAPLTEAALLIPLYAASEQLGALLLGRPVNGVSYLQSDVELLLDPSDRLADAIYNARREAEYLAQVAQVAQLVEAGQPKANTRLQPISVKTVENGLRKLTDYATLGESSLTKLKLVQSRLSNGPVTHLDRGKAVHSVLTETINKLRPAGERPGDLPSREWYPYLILHDAYLEDTPNRDIMSRLYISEGTFNRIRRAALRSVTQALEEMEAALN